MSLKDVGTAILEFIKEHFKTLLLSGLIFGNTFWISEMESLDLRFKFRGEIPGDSRIVLIDIDDASISLRPPWKLAQLEKLLRPILVCHPAAVGIDLRFYGNSKNFEGGLQAFVNSLASFSVPMVFATAIKGGQIQAPSLERIPPNVSFGLVTLIDQYYPDMDHVLRHIRLAYDDINKNEQIYPFALQLLAKAERVETMESIAELASFGLNRSPTEYHLIRYYNNYRHATADQVWYEGSWVDKFVSLQAQEILEENHAPEFQKRLAKTIHDSTIVLLGATYEDSTSADWFRTPLSWKETISGVVVHANILNWLLRRSFISEPGSLLTFFMMLGLIIISWLVIHFMEFKKAMLILVFVFLVYGLTTFLLFASWEIWLPLIWPLRMAIYFVLLLGVLAGALSSQWKKKLQWLMPYASSSFLRRKIR